MLKLDWTFSGKNYYRHSSDLGSAIIEEILPNKWRWEAHSANDMQMLDMDSWWGTESSLEEAQLAAERELFRWPI